MKIVITDYPDTMGRNLAYEEAILKRGLPGCETICYLYRGDKEELKRLVSDADAVLTAFLYFDKELLDSAPGMKCICFNATGYNAVDYEEACRRNIGIVPIGEYCTGEVADHTMALVLALARGLKHYGHDIDDLKRWQYYSGQKLRRISGMTMGILGLGKIGRAVAERAKSFGIHVIAYDPYLPAEIARKTGAELVSLPEIAERCHIITNHMILSEENRGLLDEKFFGSLKQCPIFVNTGRGEVVNHSALVKALDEGRVFGAGLDVLAQENPDLAQEELAGRENVIITPHAAFYTVETLKALQDISCENVVHYLRGEYDLVNRIVNRDRLVL